MKRRFTSIPVVIAMLFLSVSTVFSQDVLLRFNSKPSSAASYTFSTTDVMYAVDATTMTGSNSNVCFASPQDIRVQLKEIILNLKSTSATAITVHGMSSGSTSNRTILQVSVSDTQTGTYTVLDDVTAAGTKITSSISGNTNCGISKVTGLQIAKGQFVKISFCTGTSGGATQNVNISGFDITPGAVTPQIQLTSGLNPASAMENALMIPVVYNYLNVADANNVTSNWYTDNTYITTSTAPSGLSLAKNTTDKSVTLSGTPATGTVGTYYYKVGINETNGNSIQGSVIVSAYTTPAPVFDSPATKNQAIKAGVAISDIVFNIQNATNATVTGLPAELTGTFVAVDAQKGTFTISGTPATPASYPTVISYTITAVPLSGYTGADITATGTITVKDPAAKSILYLATDATTIANDLFLADLSTKFDVTKRAPIAGFTGNYDAYDLIVLHESLTGGDAATPGHELNLMKSVDKPILNTKSYFYTAGTTPRWGWGTPSNGNSGKGVAVVQPSHPVFNGITLSDSLYIYNTMTAKNIQPTTVTIGGYQLAKVPGGVAIHDIPASIRLGAGKTSKYIMISLLNGKFNDLTADGLKLLENAVDYLLNGSQFAAPSLEISSFTVNTISATIDNAASTITAQVPAGTGLTALKPEIVLAGVGTSVSPVSGIAVDFTTAKNYTVTDGINSKIYAATITEESAGINQNKIDGILFDGKIIHNNQHLKVQIYDITGRILLTSNRNIDMSSFIKGIYILKCTSGSLKISLIK